MTRDEYSRTLRYMEHIRMASYEAETKAEARRLNREYAILSKQIEPYALDQRPFDADRDH